LEEIILELLSRNMISDSIRLCYSIIYALILGFGFAIGAECDVIFTGSKIYGSGDQVCSVVKNSPHWYQKMPSKFWGGFFFFRAIELQRSADKMG